MPKLPAALPQVPAVLALFVDRLLNGLAAAADRFHDLGDTAEADRQRIGAQYEALKSSGLDFSSSARRAREAYALGLLMDAVQDADLRTALGQCVEQFEAVDLAARLNPKLEAHAVALRPLITYLQTLVAQLDRGDAVLLVQSDTVGDETAIPAAAHASGVSREEARAALDTFMRTMQETTIPAILADRRARAQAAAHRRPTPLLAPRADTPADIRRRFADRDPATHLICSFCGRGKDEVRAFLQSAASDARICDQCIANANAVSHV